MMAISCSTRAFLALSSSSLARTMAAVCRGSHTEGRVHTHILRALYEHTWYIYIYVYVHVPLLVEVPALSYVLDSAKCQHMNVHVHAYIQCTCTCT